MASMMLSCCLVCVKKQLKIPFKNPHCEKPQPQFKAFRPNARPYYLGVTHSEVHDCCLTKYQEAFDHTADFALSPLLHSSSQPTDRIGNQLQLATTCLCKAEHFGLKPTLISQILLVFFNSALLLEHINSDNTGCEFKLFCFSFHTFS